jgi:choline kinase
MRGGRSTTAITPLNLDDGLEGPLGQQLEASGEDEVETQARHLMHQTRLWRVINSAQWIAWGIVQAKVPGMDEGTAEMAAASGSGLSHDEKHTARNGEHKRPPVDSDVEEEEAFDYLAYAQDRAMFFWSDLLALDLVNPDDLPAPMVEHIRARTVDY